jgi:hypothetical protein
MIQQFSINLYLFFTIKFDNIDFMDENSKNYELIHYLINNGFELIYNPIDLLNIIGNFNIKSILDSRDIKYSESLIKNNKVLFIDYYNSMKSITMMKYIFQECKNDYYNKNRNITSKYNYEELLNTYKFFILSYAINEKSNLQKSSSENDIVDFILLILTYIMDSQNILLNTDIINNFSNDILKMAKKNIKEFNDFEYRGYLSFYDNYISSRKK